MSRARCRSRRSLLRHRQRARAGDRPGPLQRAWPRARFGYQAAYSDCRSPDPNRRLEARVRQVGAVGRDADRPRHRRAVLQPPQLVQRWILLPAAKGIDQVDPFLPQLATLIEQGPVPFTGLLTMNLVEVSPRTAHAAFLLSSALTWLRRQPTNTLLWVDGGLGARVALWLEAIVVSTRHSAHPPIC